MEQNPSYRPHNSGHDYYAPGIYLITLVVRGREPLLGRLNDDERAPAVVHSALGAAVWEEWEKTPAIQQAKGNNLTIHGQVVMPDHWHGIIEVKEQMAVSLGYIVQLFKAACTGRWRKLSGYSESPSTAALIRHMSAKQRQAYYAAHPREQQPLWDDNYDDTICLDQRHFQAMQRYVQDNPRRAIIRRLRPEFMRRVLHVRIGEHDYAAFGNLFLLRWPRRLQVFCHRKARMSQLSQAERQRYGYTYQIAPEAISRVPYEQTEAFRQDQAEWERLILAGATVLVTPGISPGERTMKNLCLERGFPLIHLQKEPIGPYWKPEASRFAACESGRLLILAPWDPETLGDVNGVPQATNYSVFHNLNTLAEEICSFEGSASICL